jgi:2-methylcitrate dehydratase PrpD
MPPRVNARAVSLTMQLADWVAGLSWEALPPPVRDQARRCLLDTLGCGIAGSLTPEGLRARAATQDWDTQATCTFWGTDARGSTLSAAFVNGTAGHALELDDVNYTMGHPGVPVVPAIVAVAEWLGSPGRDVLTAVIVGYEVGSRIAAALGYAAHTRRGWHPTGTCGGMAAAAAVGWLFRLSSPSLVSAIGLAGSMAGGVHAYKVDGAMSKRLHAGHAAQSGVQAALLARRDFMGPAWILDAEWGGLLGMMSDQADGDAVVRGLSNEFAIMNTEFKLYPSCYSAHTSTEAALDLYRAGIRADQVAAVRVEVNALSERFCGRTAGRTPLAIQMSIPYAVAVAILHGRASIAEYSQTSVEDPRVWELECLVEVSGDPRLPEDEEPSVVEVRLNDGRILRQAVATPRGSRRRPLTWDELRAKFHELAGRALPEDRVRALEAAVTGESFLADSRIAWATLGRERIPVGR